MIIEDLNGQTHSINVCPNCQEEDDINFDSDYCEGQTRYIIECERCSIYRCGDTIEAAVNEWNKLSED